MEAVTAYNDGLISIEYATGIAAVRLVFVPDAPYDVRDVLAYVHDMSEGTSRHVMIYEGDTLVHNMKHIDQAGWVNIADGKGNGL